MTADRLVFLLQHLGVAALATALAFVLGCGLTRRFAWLGGWGERFAVASTVGLACWGQILFLLGLVGGLRPLPIVLAFAALTAISLPAVWRRRPAPASASESSWRWLAAAAMIAPTLLAFTARSLHPPIGPDSTMYHLPYAKAFAASGHLPYLPDLRFPIFPQLQEVLFSAALLLWDDLGAQLLQGLAALLTAGVLFAWGRSAGLPGAGLLGAAIWLGTPLVWWLAGRAYVDLGLTLFVTAAIFAFDRYRRTGAKEWLTLAAWMAGCAAASKYTGLFAVVAVVALAAWDSRGARLRSALWVAAVAGVACAPWYLRIYWHTGTPVYPFLQTVFSSTELPHSLSLFDALLHRGGGVMNGFPVWASLPWTLAKTNYSLEWGFAYLLGVPLAAWIAWREPWARRPGAILLAWSLVYAFIVFPDPRLLLPIAPLWAFLAAAGVERLLAAARPSFLQPVLLAVLIVLALLPGLRLGARGAKHQWSFPVTAAEREDYLTRTLPAYASIADLNRTHGSAYSLYSIFAEGLNYYVQGRVRGDWFGPAAYGTVFPLIADPERLAKRFLELEVDYVVFGNIDHPLSKPPTDAPPFGCRFELLRAQGRTRLFRVLDPPRCPETR